MLHHNSILLGRLKIHYFLLLFFILFYRLYPFYFYHHLPSRYFLSIQFFFYRMLLLINQPFCKILFRNHITIYGHKGHKNEKFVIFFCLLKNTFQFIHDRILHNSLFVCLDIMMILNLRFLHLLINYKISFHQARIGLILIVLLLCSNMSNVYLIHCFLLGVCVRKFRK